MSDKTSVRMTPESDGFAARYDRMVERPGTWALRIFIGTIVLVVVIGLISQFAG